MIKEKYLWVKQKLEERPNLRDSNEQLYYTYLLESNYDCSKSIKEFLKDMYARKIPYIDVLGRASRKVQEENPELRGLKYGKRKTKLEPSVRLEIKEMRNDKFRNNPK